MSSLGLGWGGDVGGGSGLIVKSVWLEPVSEHLHVVHGVGSVVDFLQEVFQLLDENPLLKP